jgi:hypothetical protein
MAITPPNDEKKAPISSSAGLGRGGSPIQRNEGAGGDRRMGSYPLGGSASPIERNRDIPTGCSDDPNLPVAVEPGKGAVPVNPGIGGIGTMPVAVMSRGK